MNALDNDLIIDSASSTPPPPSRRRWIAVGAAAVALATVTAGIALVVQTDEPAKVVIEHATQSPTPPAVQSDESVKPPVNDPSPPPAPLPRDVSVTTRLEPNRFGPVQVGMTLDEASAATGRPVTIVPGSNLPGTGACAHAVVEGGPRGVRFMVVNGRIVRIEVVEGPVATVEGVTTHTSVQDVLTAYAGRIRVEPHTYTGHKGGQYLIYEPEGANGVSMLFETDGNRVTTFRSGLTGAVMAPEGCA